MEGSSKLESSYNMKTNLIIKIENVEWPSNDEYLDLLKKALDEYHKMIEEGVLVPRGNRIANVIISSDNYSIINKQ